MRDSISRQNPRATTERGLNTEKEKRKSMSIIHLPVSASADEICGALNEDGCVVVDRVVRPEAMDEVADELRPFTEKTPLGADEFSGRRTRRTAGLIPRSPKSRQLSLNPTAL